MNSLGNCQLAIIMIACACIFVCVFGIVLVYYYHKHKKILEDLTKYEIDVGATIDEEIPKILELFVQSVFVDYQAKNLVKQENEYIRSDEEQRIVKEVATLCGERISPAMVNKLSLFWNPEVIAAVIADKVYLTVVAYVAQNNAVHNSVSSSNK